MSLRRLPSLGTDRVRLVVEGPWSPAADAEAERGGFDVLELHRGLQADFSFLVRPAGRIRNLKILCDSASPAGLESLLHLESLTLGCPLPRPFDFSALPQLRFVSISAWQPWYAASLFTHPSIESLHIEGYDGDDLSGPAGMPALQSLVLTKGRFKSLAPLARCASLRSISLAHNRALADIGELALMPGLQSLELGDALPGVIDLAPIAALTTLQTLIVSGAKAQIAGTRWLSAFGQLVDLRLQTGVVDADFADLIGSASLRKLAVVLDGTPPPTDEVLRQLAARRGLRVQEITRFGTRKRPALLVLFDAPG